MIFFIYIYQECTYMLLKFADTKFGTEHVSLPQVMDFFLFIFLEADCSVKCPFLWYPPECAESGTVTPFSIGSRSAEPQLDPSYNPPVCKCGLFPTSSSANHRASQPEDERQIWALHRFLMPLIQPISLKKQKPLSVQQSQCAMLIVSVFKCTVLTTHAS